MTEFKITDVYDITGRGVATLDLDKALRSAQFLDRMKSIVAEIEAISIQYDLECEKKSFGQ